MKLVKRIIIYSLLLIFSIFMLSSCKPRHYHHAKEYLMQDLDYMAIVYMPKNRKDGDFKFSIRMVLIWQKLSVIQIYPLVFIQFY